MDLSAGNKRVIVFHWHDCWIVERQPQSASANAADTIFILLLLLVEPGPRLPLIASCLILPNKNDRCGRRLSGPTPRPPLNICKNGFSLSDNIPN